MLDCVSGLLHGGGGKERRQIRACCHQTALAMQQACMPERFDNDSVCHATKAPQQNGHLQFVLWPWLCVTRRAWDVAKPSRCWAYPQLFATFHESTVYAALTSNYVVFEVWYPLLRKWHSQMAPMPVDLDPCTQPVHVRFALTERI